MAKEEGTPSPVNSRRFAAFISYSHADAAIAAKLQRQLERYRLPKHVVAPGVSPGSGIGRIFRDREDLAAAANLSEAIREAIAAADALVVVCSPDARQSLWVGQEIALFRQLHPERPVLAAIARGEPGDAFPPALSADGLEPLAADLRKEGDGWSLGFLKIVAGIAGVPLDTLVQRDAQRRVRRVMWITGAALTAMLAMGVMTTLAFQARNEAARQRASAEGLVEYMLTDLRQKLKGVGRLDVMEGVNRRALAHYRAQGDLSILEADSLERRARLLHALGEDHEIKGDFDRALVSFREAHRTTAAILAKRPGDLQALFAHGQSEYWLGHAYEMREDWPAALRQYQEYEDIGKRLLAAAPSNPDYMMEKGWGALNIGIIQMKSRQKPDYGQANFAQAITWMERVRKIQPTDGAVVSELGNAWAWLADSRYLQKDYAGSLAARRKELDAKSQIFAADTKNEAARFDVAKAKYAVAANLRKLDRQQQALPLLAEAERDLVTLVNKDPANQQWKTILQMVQELQREGDRHATGNR